MVAGDPESIMLKVLQGTPIPDPNDPTVELITQIPPNELLKDDIVDVFFRWVMAGMPQTAADAAPSPPRRRRRKKLNKLNKKVTGFGDLLELWCREPS
jgi:hypothetical protein